MSLWSRLSVVFALVALPLVAPAGEIQGYVVLEGESSHEGVAVTLDGGLTTFTDESGFFLFEDVPNGGAYLLRANVRSFEPRILGPVIVDANGVSSDLFEMLPRVTGAVEGIVKLEGLSDHSGMSVALVGTPFTAVTDSQGSFWIDHVPSGQYRLAITPPSGFLPTSVSDVSVIGAEVQTVPVVDISKEPVDLSSEVAGLQSEVIRLDGFTRLNDARLDKVEPVVDAHQERLSDVVVELGGHAGRLDALEATTAQLGGDLRATRKQLLGTTSTATANAADIASLERQVTALTVRMDAAEADREALHAEVSALDDTLQALIEVLAASGPFQRALEDAGL
ncbi:MAG: hypothetical protein EP330_08235 [Deltaproteobacteria bacterium]|nr:MAG: hypothetical protein EP330_08235 [Deltaproteobacteria bacterium]